MNSFAKYLIVFFTMAFASGSVFSQKADTSYIGIAPKNIQNMIKRGKAPRLTLQLSANYNIGLMDLASNDNTSFQKDDFIGGRDFGTRYGYGISLTGKYALHKEGNVRLTGTFGFNRFQSNFVISESPDGKVSYNVIQGALGLENCFTPDRPFKPYIGFDIIASFINGKALIKTDTTDFNLTIKNATRIGFSANFGFEYSINNNFGFNLGVKLSHINVIGRKSQVSANVNESYLNDDKVTGTTVIPFAGWKQFFYSTFFTGINYYFGMKVKK